MEIEALYEVYKQYPSVQTDTRKLKENDLFFALKGPSFNGNTFAQQAIQQGAAYAIIDEPEYADGDKYIVVDDVLATLQALAHYHRRQFKIPFIAITGSNGKTTTKELVTTVLKTKYKTFATQGNLNNHIGVPLTLLSTAPDAEIAVIEMGANHQKEIASYCTIAEPTHAIITNCGKAHIEGFGGEEGVRKGKGELYDYIRAHGGTIFRNTDLDYLKGMALGINEQVTYGSADAQYIGKPLLDDVFLKVAVLSSGAEATVNTNLVGEYNFPNVMVAVAAGLYFGISIDDIKAAIATYTPDNSRSQLTTTGTNKLILDAYNANPTSMRAAINNFVKTELNNKMLWLGGMKEMGADEEKEHRELVAFVDQFGWKDVIFVGKEFKGLNGEHKYFETSADAAVYIRENKPENASILVKGSRGSRMEVMVEAIQ